MEEWPVGHMQPLEKRQTAERDGETHPAGEEGEGHTDASVCLGRQRQRERGAPPRARDKEKDRQRGS